MKISNFFGKKKRSELSDEEQYAKNYGSFSGIFWIPRIYVIKDGEKYYKYQLSFLQKLFVVLEDPGSCLIAKYVSYILFGLVLLSVVLVILTSLPSYQYQPSYCHRPACDNDAILCPGIIICAPTSLPIFNSVDIWIAYIFLVDVGTRIALCSIVPTRLSGTVNTAWNLFEVDGTETDDGDISYSHFVQFGRYVVSVHVAIDVLSVLPTILLNESSLRLSTSSLTFLRIFRLVRVFRAIRNFPEGRHFSELFSRTISLSKAALTMLLAFMGIISIFGGALLYSLEGGTFTVNEDYPQGAFLRPDGRGGVSTTPFDSIPTGIYLSIITMTTVGYGDVTPTTLLGRALVTIFCVIGVLGLALPISVIGNNFSAEYVKCTKVIEAERLELRKKGKASSQIVLKRIISMRSSFKNSFKKQSKHVAQSDKSDQKIQEDTNEEEKESLALVGLNSCNLISESGVISTPSSSVDTMENIPINLTNTLGLRESPYSPDFRYGRINSRTVRGEAPQNFYRNDPGSINRTNLFNDAFEGNQRRESSPSDATVEMRNIYEDVSKGRLSAASAVDHFNRTPHASLDEAVSSLHEIPYEQLLVDYVCVCDELSYVSNRVAELEALVSKIGMLAINVSQSQPVNGLSGILEDRVAAIRTVGL